MHKISGSNQAVIPVTQKEHIDDRERHLCISASLSLWLSAVTDCHCVLICRRAASLVPSCIYHQNHTRTTTPPDLIIDHHRSASSISTHPAACIPGFSAARGTERQRYGQQQGKRERERETKRERERRRKEQGKSDFKPALVIAVSSNTQSVPNSLAVLDSVDFDTRLVDSVFCTLRVDSVMGWVYLFYTIADYLLSQLERSGIYVSRGKHGPVDWSSAWVRLEMIHILLREDCL